MGGERAQASGARDARRDPPGRAADPAFASARSPLAAIGGPLMGFLNGRVTYVRYRVGGEGPLPFGEEDLERVQRHAIGRHGAADPADGVVAGWAGGDHVLDLSFDPAKNIVNDALHL